MQKTSFECLLDIFWFQEDIKKTFKRFTKDTQKIYSICLLNAFCTTSAQDDTYSRGRQDDNKRQDDQNYATKRQKVCM